MEKAAVFPHGFDQIGEIRHGRLQPECGLKVNAHVKYALSFVMT